MPEAVVNHSNLPESVEIGSFKVASGEYMKPMLRMFFARNAVWFVLPLLLTMAPAVYHADVRWAIVGLMLVFMVFPMAMVLIYINYALTLEVRWSLMEKTMVVDGEGLHLTFTDSRMRPRHIPWSEITQISRDKTAFYLHLKVRRYNFVMIPCVVLESQGVSPSWFTRFLTAHMSASFKQ